MTRIVVFAKAPVPGRVKTRLIPALGAEGAAALARKMLTDTLAATEASGAPFELCVTPGPEHPAWHGLLPPAPLTEQGEGDLGERLDRAARRVTGEGARPVFIGTDCPGLDAARLARASALLDTHTAVIHPAQDGGYALLGLARHDPSIFSGIGWSGPSVAEATIARIRALGWSLHIGETLRDIDEPEDLALLAAG